MCMSLLWGKLEQNLFFKFLKLSHTYINPELRAGAAKNDASEKSDDLKNVQFLMVMVKGPTKNIGPGVIPYSNEKNIKWIFCISTAVKEKGRREWPLGQNISVMFFVGPLLTSIRNGTFLWLWLVLLEPLVGALRVLKVILWLNWWSSL